MQEDSRAFLLELLETASPSGFESAGQRVWRRRIEPLADRFDSDAYGNAWATREGAAGDTAPRVLLEAHADEIGFMVRQIADDGFLRVTRIGGMDRALARGRRVRLLGDDGPVVGVVGNTAIHLRDTRDEKVPEYHELYVDVGAANRDEVASLGLRVGHPMVFDEGAAELADGRLTGRAIDNRIGGFILAETLRQLGEGERTTAAVIAANAVQEEIGGNGAKMIAYGLQPDVAIVLDVTHATDTPGIDKAKHGDVRLGGGPTLTHGKANHPELVRRLQSVAAEHDIPIQHEAVSHQTGTDTDDIYYARGGIASALVSLPMRYMHSPVETVSLEDVDRCVALLAAFVRSVETADAFRVGLD